MTNFYEKKYPKTLEYMRKFEGRKFESISRHNKNEMGKLIRQEDKDVLTEAPSTAEAYFSLGGHISKYLTPESYFATLNQLFDNNDSAIARNHLIDYTIKAMRHAVDKAVEDLWSDVMESDDDIDEGAKERALIAQQEYGMEQRMAA